MAAGADLEVACRDGTGCEGDDAGLSVHACLPAVSDRRIRPDFDPESGAVEVQEGLAGGRVGQSGRVSGTVTDAELHAFEFPFELAPVGGTWITSLSAFTAGYHARYGRQADDHERRCEQPAPCFRPSGRLSPLPTRARSTRWQTVRYVQLQSVSLRLGNGKCPHRFGGEAPIIPYF